MATSATGIGSRLLRLPRTGRLGGAGWLLSHTHTCEPRARARGLRPSTDHARATPFAAAGVPWDEVCTGFSRAHRVASPREDLRD
jgi:hypothetical protein